MPVAPFVRTIARSYPIIWHRCHTAHSGRTSALSNREAMVLQHLSGSPLAPVALAKHLGIASSTLSEAIHKLIDRGLAERHVHESDRRRVSYCTTEAGEAEIDAASPLSADRLAEALARLSPEEQRRAAEGLELLAGACRELPAEDA